MYRKARYSANTIAKEVINYSNRNDYPISNLKLQKVLYFIQAIFLNEYNRACFSDPIEAWALGPVVPSVYRQYKIFGANYIPETVFNKNNFAGIFTSVAHEPYERICNDDVEVIHNIVDDLSSYSATELVDITHSQSPWIEAYVPRFNNIISNESIQEYFNTINSGDSDENY